MLLFQPWVDTTRPVEAWRLIQILWKIRQKNSQITNFLMTFKWMIQNQNNRLLRNPSIFSMMTFLQILNNSQLKSQIAISWIYTLHLKRLNHNSSQLLNNPRWIRTVISIPFSNNRIRRSFNMVLISIINHSKPTNHNISSSNKHHSSQTPFINNKHPSLRSKARRINFKWILINRCLPFRQILFNLLNKKRIPLVIYLMQSRTLIRTRI